MSKSNINRRAAGQPISLRWDRERFCQPQKGQFRLTLSLLGNWAYFRLHRSNREPFRSSLRTGRDPVGTGLITPGNGNVTGISNEQTDPESIQKRLIFLRDKLIPI